MNELDAEEPFEAVSEYCNDVVAERRFEPLLKLVLSKPPSMWHPVAALSAECGLPRPDTTGLEGELFVTWLRPPQGTSLPLVLFAMPSEVWSTIALYDRTRLTQG